MKSLPLNKPLQCPISNQSALEELVNTLTHGLGLVGSIVGLVLLVIFSIASGGKLLFFGCLIYGSSLVLLYGASTWYHACRCQKKKYFLQRVDHACIYLLIAGSYTPFTLGPLRGAWGWSLFAVVWAIAAGGIYLKASDKKTPDWLNATIYLVMGWLVVIATKPLNQALAADALYLIFAGGIAYTVGVIFFLWNKLPFNHSIWHLFVLAGSICHYLCILLYVI